MSSEIIAEKNRNNKIFIVNMYIRIGISTIFFHIIFDLEWHECIGAFGEYLGSTLSSEGHLIGQGRRISVVLLTALEKRQQEIRGPIFS